MSASWSSTIRMRAAAIAASGISMGFPLPLQPLRQPYADPRVLYVR
jgi:hypothetical protein